MAGTAARKLEKSNAKKEKERAAPDRVRKKERLRLYKQAAFRTLDKRRLLSFTSLPWERLE